MLIAQKILKLLLMIAVAPIVVALTLLSGYVLAWFMYPVWFWGLSA